MKDKIINTLIPYNSPLAEFWMPEILSLAFTWLVEKGMLGRYGGHSVKNVTCQCLDLGLHLIHDKEWFNLSTGWSDVPEQTWQYEGEGASHYLKSIYKTCVTSNRHEETVTWTAVGNLRTGLSICPFKNHCKCLQEGLQWSWGGWDMGSMHM